MVQLIGRRAILLGLGATFVLPHAGTRAAPAKRIVSVGGAITEIIFALARGNEIVAVDTTSNYPFERTEKLPKVGYLRALATEGILSMRPDIILADHDAGPPDVMRQLQSMGVDLQHFAQRASADTVAAKIDFVGAALGASDGARAISAAYTADLAAIRQSVSELQGRPSVLFLLNAGANGLRGAGTGTGADDMIRLAGAANAFGAVSGYQSVSPESVLMANPDFILMMQQSIDEIGGIRQVGALPALTPLRAAEEGRIIGMHGSYILGFGPRTAHAARDLAAALHRQEQVAELPARPWAEA